MNKEPNRKKISLLRLLLCLAVFLLCVTGLFFILRNILTGTFVQSYRNGAYSEFPENMFAQLRLGEEYIAPYNLGDVKYQKGDYEGAAGLYRRALTDEDIPQERECQIRINLALALCHKEDWDALDRNDADAVSAAVELLQSARSVLTEKGCASEGVDTDDGHSPDAEKLKHDIDRMLEELQNPDGGGSDGSGDSGNSGKGSDNAEGETQSSTQSQERSDQEALEQALDDQRRELSDGEMSITDDEGHVYQYIEGGDTVGYGEGTPW